MLEGRAPKPWMRLNKLAREGDSYLKGGVPGAWMRILQKNVEGSTIRFVVTPDKQPIVTPEIVRIANDR